MTIYSSPRKRELFCSVLKIRSLVLVGLSLPALLSTWPRTGVLPPTILLVLGVLFDRALLIRFSGRNVSIGDSEVLAGRQNIPVDSIVAWDILPAALYSVFLQGTRIVLFTSTKQGGEAEKNLPSFLAGSGRQEIRQVEASIERDLARLCPRRRLRTSILEPRSGV